MACSYFLLHRVIDKIPFQVAIKTDFCLNFEHKLGMLFAIFLNIQVEILKFDSKTIFKSGSLIKKLFNSEKSWMLMHKKYKNKNSRFFAQISKRFEEEELNLNRATAIITDHKKLWNVLRR